VYGIVQQMGGHIRVESAIGEGTTFIVELPLCEARTPGPTAR
jgi:signal transduction histidine kinase